MSMGANQALNLQTVKAFNMIGLRVKNLKKEDVGVIKDSGSRPEQKLHCLCGLIIRRVGWDGG